MTALHSQPQAVDVLPSLGDVLPIKFPNGQQVDTLTMVCPDCQRAIPENEIRVSVSIFPTHVASVRAWTSCAACQRQLKNSFRIRATGQGFQLEEVHDEFIRVYRVPPRLNFLERLRAALMRLRFW